MVLTEPKIVVSMTVEPHRRGDYSYFLVLIIISIFGFEFRIFRS